jgi:acetyltransferase-like isoleucine patch superfamily enzyme
MRQAGIRRLVWTVAAIVVVEATVSGLATTPAVWLWLKLTGFTVTIDPVARIALSSLAVVPSYILFALGLMGWSALATRITGARTPPNAEMRIADLDWPLLTWVRYMVAIHLVRVFAGTIFRGSPIWTMYLRLNGALIGRRAYVNTTFVSDHNLLEFGDDVVIGGEAHVSGHTVEGGVVKTASVRLGRNVTIGLNSIVDIDIEIGDDCQVGALTLVPKHSRLESGAVYAGIPAKRMNERYVTRKD